MAFLIKVYIRNSHSGLSEWKFVRLSGSEKPYRYETREEAEKIARLCYDTDRLIVKVVEE